ncbi:hypothetical protein F5Y15DRAFT_300404 [Xylariaceae sp. FL0016]|nr:hypothetical protein F5Y15DRAFT_300404 [Xylariaceae sp. FL0016]
MALLVTGNSWRGGACKTGAPGLHQASSTEFARRVGFSRKATPTNVTRRIRKMTDQQWLKLNLRFIDGFIVLYKFGRPIKPINHLHLRRCQALNSSLYSLQTPEDSKHIVKERKINIAVSPPIGVIPGLSSRLALSGLSATEGFATIHTAPRFYLSTLCEDNISCMILLSAAAWTIHDGLRELLFRHSSPPLRKSYPLLAYHLTTLRVRLVHGNDAMLSSLESVLTCEPIDS